MIRLRFVRGNAIESKAIELREGTCMPFTPSHVEAVSQDGLSWIGQHIDGGMQARPPGYDAATSHEQLFLSLPSTGAQEALFYAYVLQSIGEPYDWEAILGFAAPGHHHLKFHAICSAKMLLALRHADWFPSHMPLCVPAHCVDPRDLLLILSAVVEVPH